MFIGGPPRKSVLMLAEELPRPTFGVVYPNAPEPEFPLKQARTSLQSAPPAPEISPADALLMHLAELNPASDDLRSRVSKLLGVLSPLLKEVAALETAVKEERQTTLKASLDSIKERGRAHQKIVAELEIEFRGRDVEFLNFSDAYKVSVENVRSLREFHEQETGRFDSDATVSKREAAMQTALRKMGEAKKDGALALQFRNEAQARLQQARDDLQQLAAEEVQVRNSLEGVAFIDAETGLTVA